MKKIFALILAAAMALSLAACEKNSVENASTQPNAGGATTPTGDQKPDTVTITTLNGNKEPVELKVPYDPQRVAVLDMASLDILDNLGLGNRVVGASATSLEYLQSYGTSDQVSNLGTIKEADMEAVMACQPDLIFIGGRLSASYDALSEIAPVVYLSTDTQLGVVESTRSNATAIASIFGLESKIAEKMAGFDARIEALAAAAKGKSALVGMCTSGSFNVLGNDGRCSIIAKELGFDNLGAADTTSTHGNESSFELIVSLDPDYIFVMDRDAAIGTDGAQLAKEVMENQLVMGTRAYQNQHIIYLEHPGVWYTAEGGITALDTMLADLEGALL